MDIGILSNIMQVHQECPSLTEHLLDCDCTQGLPCLSFTGLFSPFDSFSSSRFLLHDVELAELFISCFNMELKQPSCNQYIIQNLDVQVTGRRVTVRKI